MIGIQKLTFACLLLSVSGLGSFAFAEDNSDQPMMQGKCVSDVKEYCKDITPGKGRIMACLRSHEDKISPACHQQMMAFMSGMKEAHRACKSDIETFCKGVMPGSGKIMSCLKDHEDQLSTRCKSELK